MSITSGDQAEETASSPVKTTVDPFRDERKGVVREVGNQAIWSLSSCKPGFGVDQLRDNCVDTYWQSDGQLPHLVNIQFRRKTTIKEIYVYTDYKLDESYTPNRISIRAGTNFNDLQEIEVVDLKEPVGWVKIPLKDMHDRPIRTFMIQVAVISNHQNGRDTHMRQIKVHSPVDRSGNIMGDFITVEMLQHTCIRMLQDGVCIPFRIHGGDSEHSDSSILHTMESCFTYCQWDMRFIKSHFLQDFREYNPAQIIKGIFNPMFMKKQDQNTRSQVPIMRNAFRTAYSIVIL